jgi:uncharacterized protein involved in outer membrane biogenesis
VRFIPAPAAEPSSRRIGRIRVSAGTWIAAIVLAIVAIAVALFEWNWLRAPLSSYVSARLGRPFAIGGDLNVLLSAKPMVVMDDVTIANAPGLAEPAMMRAQRVALRVDPMSLLGSTVALAELTLVGPRVLLERDADGHGNWEFARTTEVPRVDELIIDDGVVRYVDRNTATEITLNVKSSSATATPNADARTPVHFSGTGRLHRRSFAIEGDAAPLLALEHGERPFRVNALMRAGDTRARFDGTVVPNQIDNVDGSLTVQGRDLSELYPLVPVPFPWTPPYRLRGTLTHAGKVWTFRDFSGKVGDSDLAGIFALDVSKAKPYADADLVSTRLDYKELGGLVGLPPANEPPGARTAAQDMEAARRDASLRVLPTRPYDLDQFRIIDAKIRFRAKRFQASNLPLDDMSANLELQDAVLKLQPVDFGVAGGHVTSTLTLDARDRMIRIDGDVTVRGVDLNRVVPEIRPPTGDVGKLGGRARFNGLGNSVAEMLGSSNGEVALISTGGNTSKLAVVLTNLDLARATPLLLGGDRSSRIHCIVADFVAKDGTMFARSLVMDTDVEKVVGEGSVDLAQERYDLTLDAKSKRPSLLALRGPIVVTGTFKSPRVQPSAGPIAARVGAAVALGATLTPIAALLPLIDLGGHPDADCGALIDVARDNVRSRPEGPRAATAKTR